MRDGDAAGRAGLPPRRAQAGMTLVELMVALVIGLVITAAAVAALIVARNGFGSVDSTTQMRENARFTADLIHRLVGAGRLRGRGRRADLGRAAAGQGAGDAGLRRLARRRGRRRAAGRAGQRQPLGGCGGFTDTSCMNGSDVL